MNGYEGVLGLMLEREDVNPNTTDGQYETPLYRAAWKGDERVVKILLQ